MIYLAGRIEKKEGIRVTQSTLIGLSTLTRVILFLLVGVYWDVSILKMVLIMTPAMLIGLSLGRHVTLRMSREQFLK